ERFGAAPSPGTWWQFASKRTTMLDVQRDGAVFELSGALDAEGSFTLLREVRSSDGDVRIDASGLQSLDGAGLTALAVARCHCRAAGRRFEVTTVPPIAIRNLRARQVVPQLFGPPPEPAPPPSRRTVRPPEPAAAGHLGARARFRLRPHDH